MVLELLGKGGSSTVYGVRHRGLGTEHALKVVNDPALRPRLETEGELQARIRSPNVLPVQSVLQVRGEPALLMPWVRGCSLKQLLQNYRFTPEEAQALFVGLVEGAAAAHALGIIHRDLKPSNVLLDPDSGRVVPKLADFGTAYFGHSTLSDDGAFVGTRAYAAPEQQQDAANVDARADLYSLGVLLHEMLVGERPEGPGRISSQTPPPLRMLLHGLLAEDPAVRFSTAAEVQAALEPQGDRLDVSAPLGQAVQAHYAQFRETNEPLSPRKHPNSRPPPARDVFVGRTHDLERLAAALKQEARLTITGLPGVGKTRLLAHFLSNPDLGPIHWCELSAARDTPSLLATIAKRIGLSAAGAMTAARVAQALGARGRCIVALDGVDAVAGPLGSYLANWTKLAPMCQFIVTCQKPLGDPREHLLSLGPLIPDEAQQLFIERACAADAGFDPKEEAPEALASLVSALDGLPAAIELAATQVRTMGLATILDRLGAPRGTGGSIHVGSTPKSPSLLLIGIPERTRDRLQKELWKYGYTTTWIDSLEDGTEAVKRLPHAVVLGPNVELPKHFWRETDEPPPTLRLQDAPLLDQLRVHCPYPRHLVCSGAVVDFDNAIAHRPDGPVSLTSLECTFLRFLTAHSDRVVPESEILVKVWGYARTTRTRAITNAVYRLRRKIEEDPSKAQTLLRIRGSGFQVVETKREPTPPPNRLLPTSLRKFPRPRSPLVGRKSELAAIRRGLGQSRLVTLLGPAGVGKTRTATELGASGASDFPGGIFWVDLTFAQSGEVLDTIGRSLDIALGGAVEEQLTKGLSKLGNALVILDNCETQLDETANIVSICLDSCPELRFIATSREPLALMGEFRFSLAPLSLPTSRDLEGANQSDAIALLVSRIRARRGEFELAATNVESVIDLVSELDGLPLAIELAAARADEGDVAHLLAQIRESLTFLRTDERDRPERHRTLEAALLVSWNQLGTGVREQLAGLAVFEGGWSLEAAEAVLGASSGRRSRREWLTDMVRQSLLSAPNNGRWDMLLTVRRFIREQSSDDVLDTFRERHATYFAKDWPRRRDAENYLAACRFAIGHMPTAWAASLVFGLIMAQSYVRAQIIVQLVNGTLALALSKRDRAQLTTLLGFVYKTIGNAEVATDWLARAIPLCAETGLRELEIKSRAQLGHMLRILGRTEEGIRQLHLALDLAVESDVDEQVAFAAQALAYIYLNVGKLDQVGELCDLALERAERSGDPSEIGYVRMTRAIRLDLIGDRDGAIDEFERVVELAEHTDKHSLQADALGGLATAYHRAGRNREAIPLAIRATELRRAVGNQRSLGVHLSNIAAMYLDLNEPEEAQPYLDESLAIAVEVEDVGGQGRVKALVGRYHFQKQRWNEARPCFEEADRLTLAAERLGERVAIAAWLAELARAQGDAEGFQNELRRAQKLAEDLDMPVHAHERRRLNKLLDDPPPGT
ncbi:MAG: winged helix-turn-helix domain-containing protein [Myxococcota bacterium]